MEVDPFQHQDLSAFEINSVKCDYDSLPQVFGHLKIAHINARDLRAGAKLLELQNFADLTLVDVICISETFFTEYDYSSYPLLGFVQLAVVRDIRGGGGVSIYAHNSFELTNVVTASSNDQSVQLVRCRLARRSVFCDVIAFYSNHRERYAELIDLLDQYTPSTSNVPCVLCGDANINILTDDKVSSEYLSFMSAKGLVPAIREITRFESQTCLDHIFVTAGRPVVEAASAVITTNIFSDHFPIWAALCLHDMPPDPHNGYKRKLEPVPRRIFSSNNFSRFSKLLAITNFRPVYECSTADDALELFRQIVYCNYDKAFPMKLFIPPSTRPPSDEFSAELRVLRRRLDRVRRKYFRNKDNRDLKGEYYRQLKHYKKAVVNLQASKFSTLFNSNDNRKSWANVNCFLGRKRGSTIPNRISFGGQSYEGPGQVSEAFCEFFATIGDRTAMQPASNVAKFDDLLQAGPLYNQFSLKEIVPNDIIVKGNSLKGNLSGALHTIPSVIWKQYLSVFAAPLSFIFNLSVTTGRFPLDLKLATVLPLYKGRGNKDDLSNYRPITLCSFLSKIFEKCVASQTLAYLRQIDYFDRSQYGFRAGRSTDLALCDIYDYITDNCAGGHAVLGAFLDASKAFDCVSHELFLRLLDRIGFAPVLRSWFQSYLSGRLIKVRVGAEESACRPVNMGVPQGSSLGPLIFIIYINVLLNYLRLTKTDLHIVCFADDVTVLSKVNKIDSANRIRDLERQLTEIGDVYATLRLSLNTTKTIGTLFCSPQSKLNLPGNLEFFGVTIPIAESVKCLGITLSRRLDWQTNFKVAKRRCYQSIAMLARLKNLGVPASVLLLLYKTLYVPLLTYGIIVWGGTYATHLHLLEVAQNNALRVIFSLRRDASVTALYREHAVLPLQQLYIYRVACLMYKELRASSLSIHRNTLRPSPSYSLRGYHPTEVERHRADTIYNSMSPGYHHAVIWNDLPVEVRCSTGFAAFRKALLSHIRNSL